MLKENFVQKILNKKSPKVTFENDGVPADVYDNYKKQITDIADKSSIFNTMFGVLTKSNRNVKIIYTSKPISDYTGIDYSDKGGFTKTVAGTVLAKNTTKPKDENIKKFIEQKDGIVVLLQHTPIEKVIEYEKINNKNIDEKAYYDIQVEQRYLGTTGHEIAHVLQEISGLYKSEIYIKNKNEVSKYRELEADIIERAIGEQIGSKKIFTSYSEVPDKKNVYDFRVAKDLGIEFKEINDFLNKNLQYNKAANVQLQDVEIKDPDYLQKNPEIVDLLIENRKYIMDKKIENNVNLAEKEKNALENNRSFAANALSDTLINFTDFAEKTESSFNTALAKENVSPREQLFLSDSFA